jgi:hypothetical protein
LSRAAGPPGRGSRAFNKAEAGPARCRATGRAGGRQRAAIADFDHQYHASGWMLTMDNQEVRRLRQLMERVGIECMPLSNEALRCCRAILRSVSLGPGRRCPRPRRRCASPVWSRVLQPAVGYRLTDHDSSRLPWPDGDQTTLASAIRIATTPRQAPGHRRHATRGISVQPMPAARSHRLTQHRMHRERAAARAGSAAPGRRMVRRPVHHRSQRLSCPGQNGMSGRSGRRQLANLRQTPGNAVTQT